MTKKERIAELERRVAELEARPVIQYVYPTGWETYGPSKCPNCGITEYNHICWWSTGGNTSGVSDATAVPIKGIWSAAS